MSVPWRRTSTQGARYQFLEEGSTRSAYNRNLIIILVSGMVIIFSLFSGRFCAPPQTSGVRNARSIEFANDLARAWPDFLFDVSLRERQNRATFVITVIKGRERRFPGDMIMRIENLASRFAARDVDGLITIRFMERANDQDSSAQLIVTHRAGISEIRKRRPGPSN